LNTFYGSSNFKNLTKKSRDRGSNCPNNEIKLYYTVQFLEGETRQI